MTWFPAFPALPRLLPLTAAVLAALSAPAWAQQQAPEQAGAQQPAAASAGTDDAAKPLNGLAKPPLMSTPPASRSRKSEKNCVQTAEADSMSGSPDRVMYLNDNVELTQCNTAVTADRAIYRVVEDQIEAYQNVRLTRFGDLYTGDELKLRMDTGQGYMLNPTYHLSSNNAQGEAKRIDFETEDKAKVINGTYSTCEAPDPDWYLKSSTMDIDRGRDTGTATQAVVYFKDWPILWAPEMPFPLSDARKSGFLPPTVGGSNRGGIVVETPYYFNIAPNRDLTLSPTIITERGIQIGADMRYLEPSYSGETKLEVLPHDKVTDTDRWAISSVHSQVLAPNWNLNWNLNAASDDNYPNDFTRSITAASQRLLGRDLSLTYTQPDWQISLRTTGYQVLQDPLSPITQPYDRLPQLLLHAGRQDVHGFDWSFDAEAVRFWQPDAVVGDRYTMTPRLSLPFVTPEGFITPKLSFNLTKYELQNQPDGTPSQITRSVPTASLDSGLIFERDTDFLGRTLTQTLEPRLFYVRTPYRNQSLIPNFDSADADVSFAQLFSENRFVGGDRIGDANQVTAAVTTRFIEANGEERARFAIGQRYSFIKEQVTLPGDLPSANSNSDWLFSAAGKFTPQLSGSADFDYSETNHGLNQANFVMRWQPAPKKLLNLQYIRDLPNQIQQFDTSGQWPILDRWYAVGRVDYSIPDHKIVQGLLGFEYKADCWVFRFGGQHTQTATNISSTSTFFQLELNGLAQLGSNALEAMRLNVPGYQPVNQAVRPSNR
ncbi:MAG TPA: LPS-assembly protein LptD [Burkholderiaceae bacterium]